MDILIESPIVKKGNYYLNHHIHFIESENMNLYLHYWGGGAFSQIDFFNKHSFYGVYYILDGEGIFIFNKQSHPIMAGDLFILKPYTEYQFKNNSELKMLFFSFEPYSSSKSKELIKFFEQLENLSNSQPLLLNEQFNIGMLWKELLLQINQQAIFTEEIIESLANTLIKIIIQNFYQQITGMESVNLESPTIFETNAIIYNAKLYINDNLAESLTLSEVANYLHVSHRHLSRLFTKHLGVTFTQYVRSEKMNEAAILLATTDLPIKKVAQRVGFDTVHYFSSVFKKVMDIPPGEFRTRLKVD